MAGRFLLLFLLSLILLPSMVMCLLCLAVLAVLAVLTGLFLSFVVTKSLFRFLIATKISSDNTI